ncbi:hypothetical protein K438DRAFT_1954313 [Mycena galopus ATCC 62051]|nr:hypothetical protein K438DRAFT_1954313 [Mycena galopus ATCC 62051]
MAPSNLRISSDRRVHLCETWLRRSRSCPLSLSLWFHGDADGLGALQILSALVPHRARWEYLKLRLSSLHIRAIEGPTPLLRRLELTVLEDLDPIVTFSPAPLLRSLTLHAPLTTPLNVALPLGQVTSLSLGPVYRSQYVVILWQTRNLVHCELNVFFNWDATSDLPPDHDIELPCLESFALRKGDVPNIVATGYLSDFHLPALRSLHLEESFLGPKPIDTLASFISKSRCTLQQVCFTVSPDHPHFYPPRPNHGPPQRGTTPAPK